MLAKDFHPLNVPPVIFHYGIPVASVILATITSLLLLPIISDLRFTWFTLAVVVSAWYGGWRGGLLATGLSVALADYFILDPQFMLARNLGELIQLLPFIIVAIIICWIEDHRVRAQRALSSSRDQLEIILNGISDGLTALDSNGQVIFANESAARITGYPSAQSLISLPANVIRRQYELFAEDGSPLSPERLPTSLTLKTGKPHQLTFRMRYRDTGEERWVTTKSAPLLDHQKQVRQVINIFRDVSDLKVKETELRNQHERLKTILSSIRSSVISTDTEGVIELVNPSAVKLLGWSEKEVVSRAFDDVVKFTDEANHTPLANLVHNVLSENAALERSNTTVVFNRDGVEVPVDLYAAPIHDAAGETIGVITVFQDVTERRRADHERLHLTLLLEAQRRRLQNILSNVPGIVWESTFLDDGTSQRVDFVNSYAEKILGYTVQDWMETPDFMRSIIHPDDYPSAHDYVRTQILEGSTSISLEFRCLAKDGREVPIETHFIVLMNEAGNPAGTCGLMTDISERKKAQEDLAQYALDLQRSNEQLEQFAYVASHDLQEPLRMITSYLQLIERRYKEQLDADAGEFIAFAVDGASRMKSLINDLLAYSRVKTVVQDFAPFDSGIALKEALTNLEMTAADTKAQITHDTLPTINGNQAQFIQLFQNLISNALKFHGDQPPQIHIGVTRKRGEWIFSVQDNGIGMERQYLDRIFIIFQRLHNKEEYPGTGIGLAICKKVVEHHGGRIWADSQPGAGTTFYFSIPVSNT